VNWQEAMPEVQWRVNRQVASQLGLSFSDVANTINTATNGTIASYYQESGFEYPIVVQMPESVRKTVPQLQSLILVPSATGNSSEDILLGQVAHYTYGTGPSQITRLNRRRYIAVTGTPTNRSAGDVQNNIQKAIVGMQLPEC
jgi:hydrophobic/amphiphilic exporter-1 (mainly G- bacteria), HAE1 family